MHAVMKESLEDYLSGLLEPVEERAIEAHLAGCDACRQELHGMQSVSLLFDSLRAPAASADAVSGDSETFSPSPGFYARVMQEVETRRSVPVFGGFFDFALGRRLMVSSALTLMLVGGWLVAREVRGVHGVSPDAILAQQEAPGFNTAPAPDSMLATLTSYEQ